MWAHHPRRYQYPLLVRQAGPILKLYMMRYIMKYSVMVFILLSGFLITSCMENNLIGPSQKENFSFQIQVTDQFRKPLSGLQVGILHHVSGRCLSEFGYYELVDEVVALNVYKLRLEMRTPDDSIRSDKNMFLPICSFDEEDAIVGYTSINGVFRCNNELRFPNIFDPELACLYISDTVLITLRDTSNNAFVTYKKLIQGGINKFNVVWNKRDPGQDNFTESVKGTYHNYKILSNGCEVFYTSYKNDTCNTYIFDFNVNELSIVDLEIYDLHNKLKHVVLKDELLEPGNWGIGLFDGCWWLPRYNRCY
jgi:hypothetical protein